MSMVFDFYGNDCKYRELRAIMDTKAFLRVVSGPPGTGKTTLIRKAAEDAGLRLETFEVDHQSTAKLEESLRKLSPTTLDNTATADVVWLVLGAQLKNIQFSQVSRRLELHVHKICPRAAHDDVRYSY